jgi:tRNA nucleotidyltransferase (CCA-adding enzyme)
MSAEDILHLFTALDIFRRESRFKKFLIVCQAIALSQNKNFDSAWLMSGAQVAKSIDVQELIAQGFKGYALSEKLKEKRLEMITEWLKDKSSLL